MEQNVSTEKKSSEVIVVTSGKGGVGKTTTSANVGTGLAKAGCKVCLIALHVRRQDLHRLCRWRTGWLQALRLAGSVTLGGLYMREARCKGLRAGLPARSRRHDLVRAATIRN